MTVRAWTVLVALGALAWPLGAAAQTPPPGSGLQAGGLAPPGGGADTPPEAPPPTEQGLEAAEAKDSGRGLEVVWLNGEAGVEILGLTTLKASDLVDPSLTATNQAGLVVGGGIGLRLIFLTFGPRFRFGSFAAWKLWTLDGEVGLRVPLGRVEPYALVAGGYTRLGGLDTSAVFSPGDVAIRGWNVRAGGGVDFFLSHAFTLGGVVTGEALFLSRPRVDAATLAAANLGTNSASVAATYSRDGSSVGAALTAAAVVGLHF